MSSPLQSLAKFVIPSSSFLGLALQQRDFRINFCLNCGSRSLLSSVPVFRAERLDEQMDVVVEATLQQALTVDEPSRTVCMPIHCSWYPRDFGTRDTAPSSREVLSVLAHYVRGETKIKLLRMLAPPREQEREEGVKETTGHVHINIKFHNFSYRCGNFSEMLA